MICTLCVGPFLKETRNMKGTKTRAVRRNERKNESESRALPALTRKRLPLHLLERGEGRILTKKKIQIVHWKDQEAETKPHHLHLLDHIRKRNLEKLSAKRGRLLTVADLEIGHLLQVNNKRGTDFLRLGLQRSKGQPRGAILLLPPLLGDREVG